MINKYILLVISEAPLPPKLGLRPSCRIASLLSVCVLEAEVRGLMYTPNTLANLVHSVGPRQGPLPNLFTVQYTVFLMDVDNVLYDFGHKMFTLFYLIAPFNFSNSSLLTTSGVEMKADYGWTIMVNNNYFVYQLTGN